MRPALLLAMLVLAACGGSEAVTTTSQEPAAPGPSGTTLDGERISLADSDGRPVFVVAFSFF